MYNDTEKEKENQNIIFIVIVIIVVIILFILIFYIFYRGLSHEKKDIFKLETMSSPRTPTTPKYIHIFKK